MATAAYHKLRPSLTLEVRVEQNPSPERHPRDLAPVPAIPGPNNRGAIVSPDLFRPKVTAGQVCRDLEELCAIGLLEAFRDEYNIVRYRPTRRTA
jgi:hypothetical protein